VPDDPEELLELLAAEAAPLSTWVDCAKAYLSAGKEDAFTHICLEGVKARGSDLIHTGTSCHVAYGLHTCTCRVGQN